MAEPLNEETNSMIKLSSHGIYIVYGLIQSGITCAISSAVTENSDDGLNLLSWLHSWFLSWIFMVPIVLFISPVILQIIRTVIRTQDKL